jgi:hypothetical protein
VTPGDYISSMVGKPWERDGLHCWELVRVSVRLLYGAKGRRTKAELFNGSPERANWRETWVLGEWAVALMARRDAPEDLIEHAGVYMNVDGGGVLHCDVQSGVVFDSLFELSRLRTWAEPQFFVPRCS